MRCLVIGGTGLIGSAVVEELINSRHDVVAPRRSEDFAGKFDVAFLCFGIKGIKPNEIDRVQSWRVNVDDTLLYGISLMRAGTKLIYVSSDAVEWLDSHYTRQKALVEVCLLAAGSPVIVRPCTVTKEHAPEFARFMIGLIDKPGIHYWA